MIFLFYLICQIKFSVPQLFHLFGYTCPRHRLPKYNVTTKLLEGIPSHLNLVNAFLCILGPLSEKQLCIVLMFFQTLCCLLGLAVRYSLVEYLY